MKIGLIGGTGIHQILLNHPQIEVKRGRTIQRTPYGGPVEYQVIILSLADGEKITIFFISRHFSTGKFRLPNMLGHEAYMYALAHIMKVDFILATSAVGAVDRGPGSYQPRSLVLPTKTINYVADAYTFARPEFCDPVAFHRPVDFLFCPHLQNDMSTDLGGVFNAPILANSVKGPAFESEVEMSIRRRDGVDLVGMPTAYPEAVLAGEASVPYGLLCGVSNMAPAKHDGQEVATVMADMQQPISKTIISSISRIYSEGEVHPQDCPCRQGRERSVFDILGEPSF